MRLATKPECADWILLTIGGSEKALASNKGEVLLETTKAASELGVSPGRLYQIALAGEITPATKVGRSYFFLRRDVEALRAKRG